MSKRRIKVSHILYSGLGGHGSVVFSLIGADHHAEWSHSLLFLGIEPLWMPYFDSCEKWKVPQVFVRAVAGKPWRSWRAIYSNLCHQAPEVILLHSNVAILPSLLYCIATGAKLVAIEHTPNSVKTRPEWIWSGLAQIFASRVVCLTNEYYEELKTAMPWHFRRSKNRVIPNGIDTMRFTSVRNGPGFDSEGVRQGPVIGMAARFSESKWQGLLIDCVSKLVANGHPDVKLLLAGGGATRDSLRQKVSEAGLGANVEFCGNLDEEALIRFYQRLDIYVHATKAEAMSTSLMQAMSCGLPIIGSNVPGVRNQLQYNQGVLVDNNPEAFANAIVGIWSDSLHLKTLGESARAWATAELSSLKTYKMYNSLVSEIVGRK